MAESIVVFGMAHCGKSTCIGYMHNKMREKDSSYSFEKFVDDLRNNLREYDSSRDYGYLVDVYKEERNKQRAKSGTSKIMHISPIEIDGFRVMILDTPGSEHKSIQRQKGMYYGDIGIFCIEINQLISDEFFTKKSMFSTFMSTLMLWSKFKRKTIVALTKMDLCDYSEEAYRTACAMIQQLCEMINIVAIIPISINVKERLSHNIDSISIKMPWYQGGTLEEALEQELKHYPKEINKNTVLFLVDRTHSVSKQYTGKSWRIKILQGTLEVGQKVILTPVSINGITTSIKARIKTIRADLVKTGEKPVYIDYASEGSLVGIDLTDIKLNNHGIKKSIVKTITSSCGFSPDYKFKTSDMFIFKPKYEYIDKCTLGRKMQILWFGKTISFQIIERKSTINGIEIRGKLEKGMISMPVSEDNVFIINDLIIRYDNNMNTNPYLDAKLVDICEEGY